MRESWKGDHWMRDFRIRENVMEWTDLYLNYSICVTMLLIRHHNSLFGACNTSPCITPNHYEMVDARCKPKTAQCRQRRYLCCFTFYTLVIAETKITCTYVVLCMLNACSCTVAFHNQALEGSSLCSTHAYHFIKLFSISIITWS